jgi:single-stranded-DNA-specific exonuclease
MPSIEQRPTVAGSEDWVWPQATHPVLRQVLSRRHIASPDELVLGLSRLTPVGAFAALDAGVALLLKHRERRVVIVGDFDADGATSTALVWLGLRTLGFAEVSFFVPDRFTLGYGLTPGVIERLREREPSLIVTVDNGISSVAGVEAAHAAGIEVLITDHHLPPQVVPQADAIVNPNLGGETFAGKNLAGVGVAFYLLAALGRELGQPTRIAEYLDLVALGTIADLVPLDQGNRVLVSQGLARVRAGQCRPGLRALLEVAGLDLATVTESSLSYQIAPRLNAAGRLDDMSIGVRCLTSTSQDEAMELAQRLDSLNRERRELEARMRGEATAQLDAEHLLGEGEIPSVVCLFRDDWHEGLVGLVASKIKDRCHRPTFAFAPAEGERVKGSGRSIRGFHLRDALAEVDALVPGLIERFGGHAMAAGLTLAADGLPAFRSAIEEVGMRRLAPELKTQKIYTDGELAPHNVSLEVAALLRDAGPWGQAFPEPSFEGRFEILSVRVLKEIHLKMTVRPAADSAVFDAIAFNVADAGCKVGQVLRLVYRLAVNEYRNRRSVQLVVEHIEAESDRV